MQICGRAVASLTDIGSHKGFFLDFSRHEILQPHIQIGPWKPRELALFAVHLQANKKRGNSRGWQCPA